MKKKKNLLILSVIAVGLTFAFSACNDDGDDPIAEVKIPVADFSFEIDDVNKLMVQFTNNSINNETSEWDFGDGNSSNEESPVHTYAEDGTYDVVLTVTSGDQSDNITKSVKVETEIIEESEVPENSILAGGEMEDPDAWTVYAGGENTIEHEFRESEIFFSGTAAEEATYQTHVWQAFEATAGDYIFAAEVEGGGFNNGYLEICLGQTEPVDGENYSPENTVGEGVSPDNAKVVGINFWLGCGIESFSGNIVDVGCDGPATAEGTDGLITINEDGTYYILIKAGNWNGTMGDGVSVKNISLTPVE